jgi:hypothetical protein
MICAVFRVLRAMVYQTLVRPGSALWSRPSTAQNAVERCRGRRGDPRGAGGDLAPRRRLSQGPSAHRIIGEFITRYNHRGTTTEWLIETPLAAQTAAMAA